MDYIKKIQTFLLNRLAYNNWQRALLSIGYTNIYRSSIYLSEIKLQIKKNEALPILQNYKYAQEIVEISNGKFELKNKEVYLIVFGIFLKIKTAEEIFIAHEIFVEGVYNFEATLSLNVIDIGMNVGMASLFFANNNNVKKVYAFEPFSETFNCGIENIKSNDRISAKINATNIGLGKGDRKINVPYSSDHKGRIGINGTRYVLETIEQSYEADITIKDAGENIKNIIDNEPGNWLLKVDTEGAEYEIFYSLFQANILSKFNIIIIEWHEKGPKELEEMLLKYDYKIISRNPYSKKTGMIYAFK